MSVIANTTVVSGFASIGRLDVLRQLFGHLYISTEVYHEIRAGLDEGYLFYEGIEDLVYPLSAKGWIQLTSMEGDDELRLFAQLPAHLHSGEASSIAIASHRDWAFLTDDQAARRRPETIIVGTDHDRPPRWYGHASKESVVTRTGSCKRKRLPEG